MTFLFPIENHSQRLFISICIVFTILPVTAVVLRMMARKKVGKQPDLSDKVMIGAVVMWTTDITLVKCSILLLYIQIFQAERFILGAKITIAAVVAWMLTMGIGSVFICQPFSLYWNPNQPGRCGNLHAFWIFTGVYNILTDLSILILPMPYLYSLRVALFRKIILMATFGIGFIVCIVSSVRIKALLIYQQENSTGTTIPTALLSVLEPSIGIILACVPLCRALLPAHLQGAGSRPSYNNNNNNNYNTGSRSGATPNVSAKMTPRGMFTEIMDDNSETELRDDGGHHTAGVEHVDGEEEEGMGMEMGAGGGHRRSDIEMGAISVKKTWEIQEETIDEHHHHHRRSLRRDSHRHRQHQHHRQSPSMSRQSSWEDEDSIIAAPPMAVQRHMVGQ
ncbi:hypothetical protein N3K66_004506 [Trichothecium roseum]|uniref:Uncharacterized protein n=1 Tax=Trichothecium roseum TaxID=47278 RepID=A0ACC0V2Y6_9HYPO|nr:hypothetical protein N3K66_004506 [Trichothecium roseum]